jgi:hypothetical protein
MHNSQKFAEEREAVIVEAGVAECCEIEVEFAEICGVGNGVVESWMVGLLD